MIAAKYRAQVDLLLRILPYVAKEKTLALKGGTAINLFIREMPRLSVDIDLTYLPFEKRDIALKNIQDALGRIKEMVESSIKGSKLIPVPLRGGNDAKLHCQYKNAQIKIEVNTVTRGHFLPIRLMQVTEKVQDEFGKFAAINVVSHGELYGGKICAALDRQHPRDMFDVKLLLENEGFSNEVRNGLIVGLLSHYKPICELLNPVLKNQKPAFESQFAGMANIAFDYGDYEKVRYQLIQVINVNFTKEDKDLLYSFEKGEPLWGLFPFKILKDLPAVQWKLYNIKKLKSENTKKHKQLLRKLENVLYKSKSA
jgi:predicted nucleotidyltransferase component of viral defense system